MPFLLRMPCFLSIGFLARNRMKIPYGVEKAIIFFWFLGILMGMSSVSLSLYRVSRQNGRLIEIAGS